MIYIMLGFISGLALTIIWNNSEGEINDSINHVAKLKKEIEELRKK